MRRTFPTLALVLGLFAALLAACGGSPASTNEASAPIPMSEAAPTTAAAAGEPTAGYSGADQATDTQQPQATQIPTGATGANDPSRKIIKNADFILEVEDVDIGLSRLGDSAAQFGGYVLETKTDASQDTYKTGLLRMAVPSDRFESMLQRVREGARRVLSEQSSGVDVTGEFVDVQSQIGNLEATQARLRAFLDKATTVEEALRVNAELTNIEGQIGQLKGRLQFLSQRAAYSTITVQLRPVAGATPAPEPAAAWDAAEVAEGAYRMLATIVQALATVAIWLAVLGLPLLLPLLVVALVVRAMRRRPSQPRPKA
ncbi:MAG: DUF4349 domain-containing protein [Chloroflexales bacterium]|nr:DUF4349 domain-containing protein [Chloroflexales bacterium]